MTIRDATENDAQGIVGVLNPIIDARVYTVFDTPLTLDAERAYLERFPARGIWKVAVEDADIAGFQIVEPFASYTTAFDHVGTIATYVRLDLRNRGIAAQLFNATFAAAPAKGYQKFFTFVRADNAVALHTYRRHGFSVVGTASRQAYIDGNYIDEILIEKHLRPA